jgi:polyphosphate glucokinase
VLDVGGTHVKVRMTGQRTAVNVESGPAFTPAAMIPAVKSVVGARAYDAVSIGFPGPVVDGAIATEPTHLAPGWAGFDFTKAFEVPVQVINDAAMQALGGYRRGRMLFLGLGTGLGSALVIEGIVQPLELAHLPYRRDASFEAYVGDASLKQRGKRPWRALVVDVVRRLHAAMQTDSVLLGGGNARHFAGHLDQLPPGTRLGTNADAFRGGLRLWQPAERGPGVRAPNPPKTRRFAPKMD